MKLQQQVVHCAPFANRAEVACLNCGIRQTVDRDEDGGAEIEWEYCNDSGCTRQLCDNCPTFECLGCRMKYCESHRIEACGSAYCAECLADMGMDEPRPEAALNERRAR